MRLPPPSMSTPPVAHTPDVPVPTLRAAHTLRPNLSAEHIGVEPPGVGEDPSLGHLTAGRILRRLDRRGPLPVSGRPHLAAIGSAAALARKRQPAQGSAHPRGPPLPSSSWSPPLVDAGSGGN